MVIQYIEKGDWKRLRDLEEKYHLQPKEISRYYMEAVAYCYEITASLNSTQ